MTRSHKISAKAAVQIHQAWSHAEALGMERPPFYFDLGANAGEWTTKGYLRVQSEFEELPYAIEALDMFAGRVDAENRRDVIVNTADLYMTEDGKLETPFGVFTTEERGFATLAATLQSKMQQVNGVRPASATAYLGSIPANMRAHNVNWMLDHVEGTDLKIGTREGSGGFRSIYRTVTPTYADASPNKLARMLAKTIAEDTDARADIQYDGYRTTVRTLWHNYHDVEAAGTGDIFRFGIELVTADDRSSSIKVRLVTWINQCLNYIITTTSDVTVGRKRHVGDERKLSRAIRKMVKEARAKAGPFLDAWKASAQDDLLSSLNVSNAREVYEKLVKRGYGRVPGVKPDVLVNRYVTAWQAQPGHSRTHFVNGLTRAAHEARWASPWTQHEIEEQAGQLLYVKRV